jgi:hypothetical protein
MVALDAWMALPLSAAVAALVVIGLRLRAVAFQAALDGRSFSREIAARLNAGEVGQARALADTLRPAWAADIVLRTLDTSGDRAQLQYALEEARVELELAAQRGLLALRSLGRIALPLALAIAILELAAGFGPSPDRAHTAALAFSRGLFAISVGMGTTIVCQLSYAVLAREARERLREVQLAADAVRGGSLTSDSPVRS